VDAAGNVLQPGLGPELPLGEYQVEIDFTDTTNDIDEELRATYDITTKQSFKVTDNEATRIREANLLVLYKQVVDLTKQTSGGSINQQLADELNTLFPGAPFNNGSSLYAEITDFKESKALIG